MLPHDHCENSNPSISPPEDHHHQHHNQALTSLGTQYDAHQPFFEHSDTLAYFTSANRSSSNARQDPMQPSQATRSQEDVFGELMSLAYLDPQNQQPRDGSDQLRYPWAMPTYDRPSTIYENELDVSFFVVLCDVWTADASAKVNLVIHPTSAPILTPSNSSAAAAALSQSSSSQSPPSVASKSNSDLTNTDNPSPAATRNLIGSLVASAAKLFNTEDQLGIYFVFQDLSIRTEGTFRLGFSLIDVGSPYLQGVNEAPSKVLAQTFSEPFTVFSAKKFPGMIESTPLSRAFARQGVKIPIRKDVSKGKKDDFIEDDEGE
ncbi:hypothetical protein Unana1_00259 [Umbelopsis nana]